MILDSVASMHSDGILVSPYYERSVSIVNSDVI